MIQALALSIRRLRRRPALALTAVVTLALAIGANTAIFSLLDTVALRPLPYPEADRLLVVGAAVPGQSELQEVSWPKFQALEAQSRETAAITAYYASTLALTDREHPEEITGLRVSRSFFDVWGIRPQLGRAFTAEEQKEGGPRVALLSNAFWIQRFGGDRAVLGRTLDLEGRPTTVIGVLPAAFRFPFQETQVVLPRPDEASFLSRRILELGAGYLQVAARLAPGVSGTAAQQEIDRITTRYKQERPGQIDINYPLAARPMVEQLIGTTRRTFLLLLAAVGLVLLVACADLANLMLADGLSRRHELATAVALGATPARLVGAVLRETLLVAGAGGLLGAALAFLGLRLLVAANPADLPRIGEAELSGRALAFAFLITVAAALLAALAPAWQALRTDPKRFLVEGDRATSGSRRAGWSQGLLVSGQIALALVLLSATGLLVRSLERVRSIPLGFAPDGLAVVQVTLPEARYPGLRERRIFFDELLARVRALAGVQAAGLVEYPPTAGAPHTKVTRLAGTDLPAEEQPLVARAMTSPGYLATIGARLLAGRDFDPAAPADAPMAAVVSRTFRDRVLAGRDPLGQLLRVRGCSADIEIVGVVEDIQQDPLEAGLEPMLFLSWRQAGPDLFPPNFAQLVVRSRLPIEGVAGALREAVRALDPGQPLPEVATMNSLLATGTARRRLEAGLFSGFALLALVLAALGIYGVVAHAVLRRRREIGIRMALGAGERDVLGEMLRLGGRWIAPGLAAGALGAWFAGRAMASQLFEVEPGSALHIALAALALGIVALVACVVPSRRAARIDPTITLRTP